VFYQLFSAILFTLSRFFRFSALSDFSDFPRFPHFCVFRAAYIQGSAGLILIAPTAVPKAAGLRPFPKTDTMFA